MTDYYVRPVNGSDSNGGTGPDNAWKTFFTPGIGNAGGTYNNAQVTDGDKVFLWAEGVTGGEVEPAGAGRFAWFFPLLNGNVSLIGVNSNGIEDGTRYNYYCAAAYGTGFSINSNTPSGFAYAYPELNGLSSAGLANYILTLKNIRWTEAKTLDPSINHSNGTILVGGQMASSRPVLINCESGPFTSNGTWLPYQNKWKGDIALIDCYFHDITSTATVVMSDPTIVGCLFDNVATPIDARLYGSVTSICNNVFINGSGNGVIDLNYATENENCFSQISNNVFYNNDGYCIKTLDDKSIAKLFLYNNVFDSNATGIDLNSITHTYSSLGGAKNVFRNNTNNIINSGSATIQDFLTTGFGGGGSGGVGTTLGSTENYFIGDVLYSSTTGTGDFRVKTTGSLDQLGYLKQTVGIGLAPFSQTTSGSLSLGTGGLGDVVDVTGRSFQRTETSPNVWRRYNAVVAADSRGNFVPTDISGLVAWWDPSDSSTITLSGSDVTVITNKVSGGKSLVPSNASPHIASASRNGKDVLDFATNDALRTVGSLTTSSQVSIITAFDLESDSEGVMFYNSAGQWCTVYGGTYTPLDIDKGVGTPNYYINGNTTAFVGGESGPNTRDDLEALISAGTGWNIMAVSEFDFGSWSSDFTFMRYPSEQYSCSGLVADLIVVPSNVSTEDRQKLEGYLAHKWDLTAKLPSDHPYKIYGP